MYSLYTGGITDEGVKGKVNQDDFFIWRSPDGGSSCIMAVFDGHGRDMGHHAARFAKESFTATLCNSDALAALRVDPRTYLHNAFVTAHAAIIKVGMRGGRGGRGIRVRRVSRARVRVELCVRFLCGRRRGLHMCGALCACLVCVTAI